MKIWLVLSEEPYDSTTSVLSAHTKYEDAKSVVQRLKESDETRYRNEPSPSYDIEDVELEDETETEEAK